MKGRSPQFLASGGRRELACGNVTPWSNEAATIGYHWLPFAIIPIVGPIIEKAGELVVGFMLFKVLGNEARRYRETAPDLPPSLRL